MRTITFVFSFTFIFSTFAVATLLYVELPDGLSSDSLEKPNIETSKRINTAVTNSIKQWYGDTLNTRYEVFSVVMTSKGQPVLPDSDNILKSTETKGNLTFTRGFGWEDAWWLTIYYHIVGDNTYAGAYRWLCWFYGYPLASNSVMISYTDNPFDNYYNISTNEIYIFYTTNDFPTIINWELDPVDAFSFS